MILLNAVRCPSPNVSAWLLFSFCLHSPTLLYHLDVGQYSAAIGFTYFLVWYELRANRQVTAGLALGLACSMKAFPGLLLVFLLVTRRYRAALVALGTGLVVAVIMTALLGVHYWVEFIRHQPLIAAKWLSSTQNASIHGIVARLFHPACEPGTDVPRIASILSTVIALAVVVRFSLWVRRASRDRASFDLSFGAFAMLSLFASQWVWEHYKIIYLVPLTLMVVTALDLVRRHRQRGLALATLVTLILAAIDFQTGVDRRLQLRQFAVMGYQKTHVALHLNEIINWLPLMCSVLVLGLMLRGRIRHLGSATAPTSRVPSHPPATA